MGRMCNEDFETVSWHGRPGDGEINKVAVHWGYVQMFADVCRCGRGIGPGDLRT